MNQQHLLTKFQRNTVAIASVCALVFAPASTLPTFAQSKANTPTPYALAETELSENVYVLYRIVERMARANELNQHPWRVVISPEYEINAHATEANLIVIYSGLLDQLAGDTSALACVVGHEMAHHAHRHLAIRSAEYTKELEEINESNPAKREQRLTELNKRMGELNRKLELDADASGYEYAVRAGFEPEGCLRSLDILSRLPGSGHSSKTHPSVSERMRAIQALMVKHPAKELAVVGYQRLRTTEPLTYYWSAKEKWLRVNSVRGGCFKSDLERVLTRQ
ncbi:MAG: M48 family metallopeptidase [Cyanobacteriota bacterium]